MAETTTTIRTRLTGDASGLVSAAQSAGSAMMTLSERKIAAANRAREAYMAELAALRLQASGHAEMAAHIRSVAAAREQAYRLSQAANIPLAEAIRLVGQQAAAVATYTANVERLAAAQAQAAQAARTASAAATAAMAAQSREVNEALNAQRAAALAAQATAAASQAAATASRDAAAALDIQRQAALRANAAAREAAIANPRATGLPGGRELPPLTPAMLAAMDRHTAQTRELSRQQGQLSGSTRNSALGFLAFSQALEDSQYGIKGVLNNIPQMIMGFGGGAGLAGALSIAAVAAVVLYPELKRLTGAMEAEKLDAYANSLRTLGDAGRKVVEEDYQSVVLAREMVAYGEELAEQYRQRFALGSDMAKVWLDEIDARKQVVEFEEKIADLKTRTAKAEGKDVSNSPAIAHAKQLAEIEEETIKRKKIEKQLQADLTAQSEKRANVEAENAKRIIALEKERRDLQGRIEMGKAQIASDTERRTTSKKNQPGWLAPVAGVLSEPYYVGQALGGVEVAGNFYIRHKEALREATLEQKKFSDSITISTASLARNKASLTSLTGQQTELNKSGADAVSTAKAEIDALNAKLQLNDTEIKQLATKTAQLKEAKKEADKLRDAESARDARSIDPRQGGYYGGETPEEAAEGIEKEAAGSQSRQDLTTELDMLKLQQQGRSKIAEELGKEVELRKEAAKLAAATNRSEEEMLATLREKRAQEKDVSDARRSGPERRADMAKIRASEKDRRVRDSRTKNRLDRPLIPRTNQEKARAKEREEGKAVRDEQDKRNKAADAGKGDDAAKQGWNKLITTQEKLSGFLEELSKI